VRYQVMGHSVRSKRKKASEAAVQGNLSLKQAEALSLTISNAFVRDRAVDYATYAFALANKLDQLREADTIGDEEKNELKEDIQYFGKCARRLDLIRGISIAAGYLSAGDRAAVHAICSSIENKYSAYAEEQGRGVLQFFPAAGGIKVILHSHIGRMIAGVMARFVPPPDQSEGGVVVSQTAFLSEKANARIDEKLASAKAHGNAGRAEEAAQCYREVLKIDRKNGDALLNLGRIYHHSGQISAALGCFEEAHRLYADNADVTANYGFVLIDSKRYDEAVPMLLQALKNNPNHIFLIMGLGFGYFLKGEDEKALAVFEDGVKRFPRSAELLASLGAYYYEHYDYEKSFLYFARAQKESPGLALALHGLGLLLDRQGKSEEGLQMVDKALSTEPNDYSYIFTKVTLLLASGRFEEGWALHERLLPSPYHRNVKFIPKKPVWTGSNNPKTTLLIHCEQGLGDNIQFIRYAALCKERVGKVYVLCSKPLKRLFECCPSVDGVYTGISRWGFDEQVSMLSLPAIFKTTLETVPADVPYFVLPPKIKRQWANKIVVPKAKLKVGLVWSGSMFKGARRGDLRAVQRNVGLEKLLPLFDFDSVVFCSLQKGEESKQIDDLNLRNRFIDVMDGVEDMLDTAAIIEQLDLVISVDTSVAHLAGALGKPVWILSRHDACWRWMHNLPTSPWYPAARIFGQPKKGDWISVVQDVALALKELLPKP